MSTDTASKCPFHHVSTQTVASPAVQAEPSVTDDAGQTPAVGGGACSTGCPITRIKNFFSFRTGAKAARFGAVGTASLFTLCGIKCIALYVVLPSVLAGAALTNGNDSAVADQPASNQSDHPAAVAAAAVSSSQETAHESVPVSCPFHRVLNSGGSRDASLLAPQD